MDRHEDWSDEDLAADQGDDPHDEVIVSPQAWQRVQAEKQREIATLVKDGTLQGEGKGKSLKVELGPFYDWLGEPAPVEPAWAKAYDVRPDSDDEVMAHRFGRERAWKAYRWGPTAPIPDVGDLELDEGEPSRMDEVVAEHKERVRSGVEEQWRLLGALELVVSEVAVECDGEDPAIPVIRQVLDHSRERLEELRGETERFMGPFELPDPDDEEVAFVCEIAERQPPWS